MDHIIEQAFSFYFYAIHLPPAEEGEFLLYYVKTPLTPLFLKASLSLYFFPTTLGVVPVALSFPVITVYFIIKGAVKKLP